MAAVADEAAGALAADAAAKPAAALALLVQAVDSDDEELHGELQQTEAAVVVAAPVAADDSAASADAAAHVIETSSAPATPLLATPAVARDWRWKLRNYVLLPALMPLLAAWWLLALAAAMCVTLTVLPSLLLARRLYYACPFIPHVWRSDGIRGRFGTLGAWLLRLQFEGAHATCVLARILTLPLRPHTPSFYVLGFPKCGTTTMAAYLSAHLGISGVAGMPGNEVFAKESHFFAGILGRSTTSGPLSRLLYRSFFPTVMARWWSEAVLGVPRWMCFDACPTFACLPHVAARAAAITPSAKLVVMVRDPVAALFSAETMLRNMGMPLSWSLAEQLQPQDMRFKFAEDAGAYWRELEALPVDAPLPSDLPQRFYLDLHSHLMAGRFADRLRPWIAAFGAHNVLLVDYQHFVAAPEEAVQQVLRFVGAETARHYSFKPQLPRMVGDYKGRACDAATARWLQDNWFSDSNAGIAAMLTAQKAADSCTAAPAPWP